MKEFAVGSLLLVIGMGIILGFLFGATAIYAEFRGYYQEKRGQAALREAEWDRQIMIEEAKAANESATQQAEARIKIETANGQAELEKARGFAQAEVERAKGVVEANKIIGEGLRGNDDYLRYLWIESTKGQQVIYIPTEAGLPVLEAGKR